MDRLSSEEHESNRLFSLFIDQQRGRARIITEELPPEIAHGPEHVRMTERTRRMAFARIEENLEHMIALEDGSSVLVLDSALDVGPNTYTIRRLSESTVDIIAAKRGPIDQATDYCVLKVCARGYSNFPD